jgi:hypothetical protein
MRSQEQSYVQTRKTRSERDPHGRSRRWGRGGGGGFASRGGGGGFAAGRGAPTSINRPAGGFGGGGRAGGGLAGGGRPGGGNNIHAGNNNFNHNTNINHNNNINVNGGGYYNGYHGGYYGGYHSVAAGIAIEAAAVVTAAAIGSIYHSLPPACSPYMTSYYYCGGVYYAPQYHGSEVTYVVVDRPG